MNKLLWTGVLDDTYQVSWKSACRFWRRFLNRFYHIYGHGGHLGHVRSIMSSDLLSLYLKAFIKNLVQIGKEASEKIRFEFLYVHNLGPRSRNDLDLQYSHTFIYSIRCLLPLTFRSLAAIVFEKFHCFHFFL